MSIDVSTIRPGDLVSVTLTDGTKITNTPVRRGYAEHDALFVCETTVLLRDSSGELAHKVASVDAVEPDPNELVFLRGGDLVCESFGAHGPYLDKADDEPWWCLDREAVEALGEFHDAPDPEPIILPHLTFAADSLRWARECAYDKGDDWRGLAVAYLTDVKTHVDRALAKIGDPA